MWKYVIRRLMLGIPTAIGASILIFTIMRVAPGDVAVMLAIGGHDAEGDQINWEQVEEIRQELGLYDPLPVQYLTWVGDFVTLDWGQSLWTKQPVAELLERRYPLTLQLAVMAIVISWVIGVPVGVLAAVRQDSVADYILRVAAIVGLAVPNFFLGILVLYVLAAYAGWMPQLTYQAPWVNPMANISQLMFPALVLGTAQAAITMRMTRSTMLEVMREDYIRTARAKGLSGFMILFRHSLKNALIPVVTISGVQLGNLISGSVVVEVVFNLPGLGAALVDGVRVRDYPIVQTLILLFTVGYILVNLGVDILYSWLNPRVRYS